MKYEVLSGMPVLVRQLDFVDDKAGKLVGIYKLIGRRPIAASADSHQL